MALILETSLQAFFYDQLMELNNKTSAPLPNETIYYSSIVMDRFSESKEYFETLDGKVREKTLGKKLLECGHLSKNSQKRALRDIGDTALLLCGFFSESLNKKIIDHSYYHEVGQIAYRRLDTIVPDAFQVQSFYNQLSKKFKDMTEMMAIVAQKNNMFADGDENIIFFSNQTRIKAS